MPEAVRYRPPLVLFIIAEGNPTGFRSIADHWGEIRPIGIDQFPLGLE
jgi:hypothetical protein